MNTSFWCHFRVICVSFEWHVSVILVTLSGHFQIVFRDKMFMFWTCHSGVILVSFSSHFHDLFGVIFKSFSSHFCAILVTLSSFLRHFSVIFVLICFYILVTISSFSDIKSCLFHVIFVTFLWHYRHFRTSNPVLNMSFSCHFSDIIKSFSNHFSQTQNHVFFMSCCCHFCVIWMTFPPFPA